MMQKVKNLYLGAIVAFLYAPIVVLIAQSFNASRYRGQWTGFTWEWYEKLVESEAILNAFSNTLTIGVTSAVCATRKTTLSHPMAPVAWAARSPTPSTNWQH